MACALAIGQSRDQYGIKRLQKSNHKESPRIPADRWAAWSFRRIKRLLHCDRFAGRTRNREKNQGLCWGREFGGSLVQPAFQGREVGGSLREPEDNRLRFLSGGSCRSCTCGLSR